MLFGSIDASYYRSECNLIYGTTYEGALSLAHMENRAHGVRHRSPEPAGQRCVPLCFPVRYYELRIFLPSATCIGDVHDQD